MQTEGWERDEAVSEPAETELALLSPEYFASP
jgi:hypothetical protein